MHNSTTWRKKRKKEVSVQAQKSLRKIEHSWERRFEAGEKEEEIRAEQSIERWWDGLDETKEMRVSKDWSRKTGKHKGEWKVMRVYSTGTMHAGEERREESWWGGWFSLLCTASKLPGGNYKNAKCHLNIFKCVLALTKMINDVHKWPVLGLLMSSHSVRRVT